MAKTMISVLSMCSAAVALTNLDWDSAIDFKSDRVVFNAVQDPSAKPMQSESKAHWYAVTTLPDAVLQQASSFLELPAEANGDNLYGFMWGTMSKAMLKGESGATVTDGTEYLVYRVPTSRHTMSAADLERASSSLPAAGDDFEYAVVKPDTLQIFNAGKQHSHKDSLKKTKTMRLAFKPPAMPAGASSFLQAEAEEQVPLKFREWGQWQKALDTPSRAKATAAPAKKTFEPKLHTVHHKAPVAAAASKAKAPTVVPKAKAPAAAGAPKISQYRQMAGYKYENGKFVRAGSAKKSKSSDLEAQLDSLESQFLETESETEMTLELETTIIPLYMMTASAIYTGGMNYNNAVVQTHANAEKAYQGAVSTVGNAFGPVGQAAASVHNFGSQVRTNVVGAAGNWHNTILGGAKSVADTFTGGMGAAKSSSFVEEQEQDFKEIAEFKAKHGRIKDKYEELKATKFPGWGKKATPTSAGSSHAVTLKDAWVPAKY